MVKFNFWDRFFGDKPKRFKRNANKQIKENILFYIRDNKRGAWATREEIFENTLEQTDLFNSQEGKMFFSIQGIKSKIGWAVNELRRKGYPIISGTNIIKTNRYLVGDETEKVKQRYGKGYRYADENTDGFIDDWNGKINAWLDRKSNLLAEYKIDKILIERIIDKLREKNRLAEASKLQEVLLRYKKEVEKVGDGEDEN